MKETEIKLTIGEKVLPAVLIDSSPAKELISRLPCIVKLHKYTHDYCGVMDALGYEQKELRSGWSNGDIAFAADGNYFAILYKDQEISQQYGNMVTMGRLAVDPMIMETFGHEITVEISLR